MPDYGSVAGVAAHVRHMTFDAANNPTTNQVTDWLTQRSGRLNGWIAAAGYAVPVTQADAKAALDQFANYGAACDAEAAQRTGGYSKEAGENQRGSRFCKEFASAEAWIASGALTGLGVPRATTEEAILSPTHGLLTAGTPRETPPRVGWPPDWNLR